ncbi:hypothetical protein [Solicola gregarius]|uniref:Sulfotransferase family protein n=1 Tax=Solicola gregarius TaxID=2908642 RepID=A0AA46YK16_9ACTN|nr:hypothetical protein [Solicola gregarius]UYM05205.1 hypothetical protein L0C25_22250 [Solicola gregarius]
MTHKAFLHVGPPKTGTTYLQSLLHRNRQVLRGRGLLVVRRTKQHYDAASEITQRKAARASKVPTGVWASLVKDALHFEGDAVLSHERYSLATTEQNERIRDDLAGRELHVIFTLRDLTGVVSADWQESVKNGSAGTWPAFCKSVVDDDARLLRKRTRALRSLRSWAKVLPPEQIHVVTVPPSGSPRELLWERFCSVLGVDPEGTSTTQPRGNQSMGQVEVELLRRVNELPESELSVHDRRPELKHFLAEEALNQRSGKTRVSIDRATFDTARRESRAIARQVSKLGFDVVGDLDDLTSAKFKEPPPDANEVADAELLDAAIDAIAALARRSARRGRKIAQLEAAAKDEGLIQKVARKAKS